VKVSKLRSSALVGVSSVFLLLPLLLSMSTNFVSAATPAAATKPTTTTSKSNSLKISPVRSDLSINPGTSAKVPVFVTNVTGNTVTLQAIENDFIAGDEKGTPSIILDANKYAPTHSLKRFMLPITNITLAPDQTKEVDVTIQVPQSAQAGGYFGAIRFAPANLDGSNSVNLSSSVGSLILMTVPGDFVEKVNLTNFDIQQNGGTGSNFRTPNDLQLFIRFENKGSVQLAPFGQIYVKKGTKTVYTSNFNTVEPKDTILPDSARRWTVPIKNLGKFGKYTVGATFGYGSKGQTIDISKTIWIVPTTYIYGGIAAVVIFIALIVFIVIFLKGYKKRILKKSRRHRY
jgi:hypothetical protein